MRLELVNQCGARDGAAMAVGPDPVGVAGQQRDVVGQRGMGDGVVVGEQRAPGCQLVDERSGAAIARHHRSASRDTYRSAPDSAAALASSATWTWSLAAWTKQAPCLTLAVILPSSRATVAGSASAPSAA